MFNLFIVNLTIRVGLQNKMDKTKVLKVEWGLFLAHG